MEELLSLKWNNHKNSFLQLLSILRKKNNYTDVTLACDGKLYNVHKMVLSACSDYFSNIFENISCPNPVIVLKDMSSSNLESLLDYMYLGEVSVRQADLASLIQAAECLKLKGLAVPDDDSSDNSDKRKRPAEPSPVARKKTRRSASKEILAPTPEICTKKDVFDDAPLDVKPSTSKQSELKREDGLEDIITIKEESDLGHTEYADAWDFNPNTDSMTYDDPNQQTAEDASGYSNLSSSFQMDPFNEGENAADESSSSFDNQQSLTPSSQQKYTNKTVKSVSSRRPHPCAYCIKIFFQLNDLKRHLRIHTGEKPYACPYCQHRANRSSALRKHMQLKHQKI